MTNISPLAPQPSTLHRAALTFARKGLAVFPCRPGGKTPASAHGVLDATKNLDRINACWLAHPDLNIGIATGAVSGVFVLDIDGNDGEASLRTLEQQHGALSATVEVVTGKGRHCYFRLGEHGTIRNSVRQIGPGLDIRGDGGYVIAPPSIHPSGRAYSWSVDGGGTFSDAPDWLHGLIRKDAGAGQGKPLEHWHHLLTNAIKNGERNNTLASVCGKLVHCGLTDVTLLFDTMLCVNAARCETPLTEGEIEDIVASVIRCDLKNGSAQ